MLRPDLKVVFYRGNSYPRTVAINPTFFTRTLTILALATVSLLIALGFATRHLINHAPTKSATSESSGTSTEEFGPFNNADEKAKNLADEVEKLKAQLHTAAVEKDSAKELDTKNPILAFLSPAVTDQTKNQQNVVVKNFSYSPGSPREPTTLSFELHNADSGVGVQKGYIVILARTKNALKFYPNVMNAKGPYLVDFEKGETFQVSRFRMVNAQYDFDPKDPITNFQVLIFKRTGELLLNLTTEVNNK